MLTDIILFITNKCFRSSFIFFRISYLSELCLLPKIDLIFIWSIQSIFHLRFLGWIFLWLIKAKNIIQILFNAYLKGSVLEISPSFHSNPTEIIGLVENETWEKTSSGQNHNFILFSLVAGIICQTIVPWMFSQKVLRENHPLSLAFFFFFF